MVDRNKFTLTRITEQNILRVLEHAYRRGKFPPYMFTDENSAYGKGRLTVFRSQVEWLIAFEFLVYIAELDKYENAIHYYGNKVKGYLCYKELFGLITKNDDVNPLDFEVSIGSIKRHFLINSKNYLTAGIDLKKTISGDAAFDRRVQILRMLVEILPPQDLFMSNSELLLAVGRPATLPLFLQLYEWCHPDPRLPEREFLTPCLRSLIKALADNNPDEYECSPDSINTHWSCWPAYGLR